MTTSGSTIFERNPFSRRRFMQYSAVGTGVVAISPYLTKLQAFAAPPVGDHDGILVTINLAGGNDGLNMVIPYADPHYATLRSSTRITNALPIGAGLGLHPSMPKLKARFDQGKVAVIRGVGYKPPDLSHFSSGDIWMRGWGGSTQVTTGWAGRFLDLLPNAGHESLYGVSLHGSVSEHLQGAIAHPSSLPLNIGGAFGIDRSNVSNARMFDALASFGTGASGLGNLGDLYDQTESDLMMLTQRIRPAYGFPDQPNDLQQQLVLAAHLINANLGIRVIDTEIDGFDTHSNERDWHATLLGRLDDAIAAFFATLSSKWLPHVAMMTFSEFGRRPEENGDGGTDHGTAAPHFVIGDHVKGGLHGTQPSLTALDRDGNFVPSVDFHQMYAPILKTWLGVDDRAVLGKAYTPLGLFKSGPGLPAAVTPPSSTQGYWLAGPTGHVHGFGVATKFSSIPHVALPLVAGARTPTRKGLWLAGSDGGIFSFGDAKFYGSTGAIHLNKPIVAMAATPTGKGYWLCASDGGIFNYGDAKFHGATVHTSAQVCGFARSLTGKGYWLAAADGTVAAFGDAAVLGSVADFTSVIVA